MLTLTDHGNALCSSVVLLLCYPCDKCHGFYNAKSTKNKKASQFPWELLNDLVFAISTQLAHYTYTVIKHLFPCNRSNKWIEKDVLKHLFPFIYFIDCVDNWTKVVNPPKPFHLICSTPSPHGYKFIFKWVVWVQLLKWWVKCFYTAKTR